MQVYYPAPEDEARAILASGFEDGTPYDGATVEECVAPAYGVLVYADPARWLEGGWVQLVVDLPDPAALAPYAKETVRGGRCWWVPAALVNRGWVRLADGSTLPDDEEE